jgi:hypothetical protein
MSHSKPITNVKARGHRWDIYFSGLSYCAVQRGGAKFSITLSVPGRPGFELGRLAAFAKMEISQATRGISLKAAKPEAVYECPMLNEIKASFEPLPTTMAKKMDEAVLAHAAFQELAEKGIGSKYRPGYKGKKPATV